MDWENSSRWVDIQLIWLGLRNSLEEDFNGIPAELADGTQSSLMSTFVRINFYLSRWTQLKVSHIRVPIALLTAGWLLVHTIGVNEKMTSISIGG